MTLQRNIILRRRPETAPKRGHRVILLLLYVPIRLVVLFGFPGRCLRAPAALVLRPSTIFTAPRPTPR